MQRHQSCRRTRGHLATAGGLLEGVLQSTRSPCAAGVPAHESVVEATLRYEGGTRLSRTFHVAVAVATAADTSA